jgi:hypothetical protein
VNGLAVAGSSALAAAQAPQRLPQLLGQFELMILGRGVALRRQLGDSLLGCVIKLRPVARQP